MIAAGVVAVAYFAGEQGLEALLTISTRQQTIDERLEISRNAWRLFLDYPGFGAGIGSFYEQHDIIVHNSALWFLAEFGAVGFTVFAGFVCWFLVKGVATYRHAGPERQPLVAGLVAAHLAMMGFSLGIEALYQRFWWLVMAALSSACALTARRERVPEREVAAEDNSLALPLQEPTGETTGKTLRGMS
jgi:O-antigen ligase